MAQTETWDSLISLVGAYMGASFLGTELQRIQALANARAWAIYRESQLWENFLVAELRTVNNATEQFVVPYEGAVFVGTNGVRDATSGSVDLFMRIHDQDPNNGTMTTLEREYYGIGDGALVLGSQLTDSQKTTLGDGEFGWGVNAGTGFILFPNTLLDVYVGATFTASDFPTDVVDINGTQTISELSVASWNAGNTSLIFEVEGSPPNILASGTGEENVTLPSVFCQYRKRLTDTFGDGTNGTTSTIPQEFYEYMALGIYADMLAADGFHEKSLAMDARAQLALRRELERIDGLRAFQTVQSRFRTRNTEQPRATSQL